MAAGGGPGRDNKSQLSELAQLVLQFGVAIVGAIASLGFVAFVGAIILWSRFDSAQLPADQAVRVQPREDLITVGAIALVLFVLGGLLAVLLLGVLDDKGSASLRTRRGLLGIVLLEIAAAFAVEQWDGFEWLPLASVVVGGLIALGLLLELAANWLGQWPGAPGGAMQPARERPFGEFWDKLKVVFGVGAGPSRVRLWVAAILLLAAVLVVIRVEPTQERYAFGAALVVAALAVLNLRVRRSSEHVLWQKVVIAFFAGAGALYLLFWGGDHWERFVLVAILLLAVAAEWRWGDRGGDEQVGIPRLLFGLLLLAGAVLVVRFVDPTVPRIVAGAALAAGGLATLWLGGDRRSARFWGDGIVALAAVVIAGTVLVHENSWIAVVAGVAVLLGAGNLMAAQVTGERFLRYGIAVFLSITLFGTAFSFIRGLVDPQAQGVAILRANDTNPICGLYVAETDDRLYYSRVDLKDGSANVRRLEDDSGRLFSVPRDRIRESEIGPLEPVDAAQSTALDLVQEVGVNREPVKRGVANPPRPPRPPRGASGADPCGPQPTTSTQESTANRRLARRFQPRLLMSKDDGFWPVSLLTIFDLQKRGKVLCRKPACVPVRSAADLPFTGGQTEWLEYPGAYDSVRQQRLQVKRALGTDDPFRSAREYFLLTRDRSIGTISLQYWFFYPFNYQPLNKALGLKAGYHEGDFEHVGVLLSRPRGRVRVRAPRFIWMARHDNEGQVFLWNEPVLQKDREHVNVYTAKGSHASYESCLEQERPAAPLGLINDRPECEGTQQLVFEAGAVPLWDLSRARWACWGGRFGHTRPGISAFEWELYEGNGPLSPLWQQRYDDQRRTPCDDSGVQIPANLVSEGEEPLGADLAKKIADGAGRLDVLVDECEDWRRPQPQGVFVSACLQRDLSSWLRGGLGTSDGVGLRVLSDAEASRRRLRFRGWPIGVRRDPETADLDGWAIRADRAATIDVYVSCIAGKRPVEAVFDDVLVPPGRNVGIDTSGKLWRLTGALQAEPQAPRLADLAREGPGTPAKTPRNADCREADD